MKEERIPGGELQFQTEVEMNKYGSSSKPLEITRFLYDKRCFLFRWKGLLKEKKLEMLVDPDL